MQNSNAEKSRENRFRRQLVKQGYVLRKSRVRNINYNDLGGYRIVDLYRNFVVDGIRFELSLDDVEEFLKEE